MFRSIKLKIGDMKADLTFQRGRTLGVLRYIEIVASVILSVAAVVKTLSILEWV